MKNQIQKYIPGKLESWAVVFVALLLLLVGNGHDLLERYGLIQSSQVVKDQLAHGVGSGLTKLDSFTATRGIVSFTIWAVVGLIAFSAVQALLRMSAHRKYEKELSSNHYIHPIGFNPNAFWKNIIIHSVISFVLLLLSVIGLVLYFVVIVPISFDHARLFLLNPSVSNVLNLLLGLLVLFVGSWVAYLIFKITYQHHKFVQL